MGKLTRALCIPFHRYQPHTTDHYRVFFDYFLKSLDVWGPEIDALYLIDSDFNFTDDDIAILHTKCPKVTILPTKGDKSHWGNIRRAAGAISESLVLFMDQDMLVWEAGVIDSWFKDATTYDVVAPFDSSGGMQEVIHKRYPGLAEMNKLRIGTYFFILNRKALTVMEHCNLAPIHYEPGAMIKELNNVAEPGDWLDSFGYFTLRLLHNNFTIKALHDPRDDIYLENGEITSDPDGATSCGYYHIRNGNLPVYLLSSDNEEHSADLKHALEITPAREILRIMAWHQFIRGDEMPSLALLPHLDITKGEWDVYFGKFKEYHEL